VAALAAAVLVVEDLAVSEAEASEAAALEDLGKDSR
jgi:hypothetical protein